MIYALGERRVSILGERWYIADNATVIGSVTLHDNVSIWFNAVVRADDEAIVIGPGSNVQDGAVLHADPGIPLAIGCGVTVGHNAMLHGCTIGDGSLIGINAVILNRAVIGQNCIVGANSLIAEGKQFPDGVLILGAPARIARALTAADIAATQQAAAHYVARIQRYRAGLHPQHL